MARDAHKGPGAKERQAIIVEIDGPRVSPANVDGVALVEIANSYLAMLRAAATSLGVRLAFGKGLRVVDKCAGLWFPVNSEAAARRSHRHGMAHQVDGRAAFLRRASELPDGHVAGVHLHRAGEALSMTPIEPEAVQTFDERDDCRRLRITGVTGEGSPRVHVFDRATQKSYHLSASKDVAKAAAGLMYENVLADVFLTYELESMAVTGGKMMSKPERMLDWTVEGFAGFVRDEFDPGRRQ